MKTIIFTFNLPESHLVFFCSFWQPPLDVSIFDSFVLYLAAASYGQRDIIIWIPPGMIWVLLFGIRND